MADQPLILLVDDEPDVLSLYKMALTKEDLTIITATNGAEAVEAAKKNHPALILMDMKMPVMDGVEAAIKLREDPETATLRLVFLTAFNDPNRPEADVKLAKEIGALDFIKKGLGLKDLAAKVKGYLQTSQEKQ